MRYWGELPSFQGAPVAHWFPQFPDPRQRRTAMNSSQNSRNFWQSRPTLTGKVGVRARPELEALESRSLLDANTFVQSLYANILQRAPTQAEADAWVGQIDSGVSPAAVAAAFAGSTERLAEVVSNDYSNFFGRNADPQEINYWAQQMAAGMTQDQVAASLVGSQEFRMRHGSSADQFIEGAYETVLHRSVDPTGLAYWKQQLFARTDHQVTFEDVASRIVGSDEAHQQQVDAIFAEILHRSADDGGRAFWAGFLDNGGSQSQMIATLAGSAEYLQETGMTAPA